MSLPNQFTYVDGGSDEVINTDLCKWCVNEIGKCIKVAYIMGPPNGTEDRIICACSGFEPTIIRRNPPSDTAMLDAIADISDETGANRFSMAADTGSIGLDLDLDLDFNDSWASNE